MLLLFSLGKTNIAFKIPNKKFGAIYDLSEQVLYFHHFMYIKPNKISLYSIFLDGISVTCISFVHPNGRNFTFGSL